ncbi:MAG TPA: hypothetical protein VGM19_05540 [Armatimonadota bacterium]|jgi:hypothetical protein
MRKIPPYVTIIIGVVLILGVSAAFFFLMVKPKSEELKKAEDQYATDKTKADTLPATQAKYNEALAAWMFAQADLEQLMGARSTPISFYAPIPAMIALWQEYRVTLPQAIERFVKSTGVEIVSGASIPAPPSTPPAPPASGYMAEPEGGVTLTVKGTLQQIERLYRSIGRFDRVMTIGGLSLTGEGTVLTASIPMKFYLLVEVPPGAAAAAAPAAGPAPPGPPGPSATAPKASGGGEETPSAKPSKKGADSGE